MNLTFGVSVTLLNAVIMVILVYSYIYHRLQIKALENDEVELDFAALEMSYKASEITFIGAIKTALYIVLSKMAIKFHIWMFYITSSLLAANTFAFIIGIFGYFIYKIDSPDLMLFGRLSDRYLMCLAFIGLSLLGRSIFRKHKNLLVN